MFLQPVGIDGLFITMDNVLVNIALCLQINSSGELVVGVVLNRLLDRK